MRYILSLVVGLSITYQKVTVLCGAAKTRETHGRGTAANGAPKCKDVDREKDVDHEMVLCDSRLP